MDSIRVTKVEGVFCTKTGSTASGTVHLTAHHLIFHYDDTGKEEMWIPYPLISLVTRLPLNLQGQCPLMIRTRTFETTTLLFALEDSAIDVFDTVKELTVATSVTQLYAFYYVPNPPYSVNNGWSLYSPREEFGRMGVGSRTKAWRFTDINKDYSFSPTYPARLVVPTRISDTTLQYAVKYRSKGRLPALTYLHWANYGSITRSSQPMVGLTQNRSIQDEKLIEAIFQSHWAPDSRASAGPVYGATSTNIIVDARPTTNAMANTAKGAGTENMDNYKEARKAYLGIDHIHVMRDSLNKVVEALREAEVVPAVGQSDASPGEELGVPVLDRQALRRSGWLKHISAIMEGSLLIVRNVHVNSSHVLIHCSDGWDRTAQLSALSQLCLDPFYRTVRGFQVLIEKDWLSFGHKFLDRCGHLSSEKFFLAPVENAGNASGAEAAQAFLASVQNRFASQGHLKETSPVFHQWLECVRQVQRQFPERFEFNERFLRQLHCHLYSCQFGTFLFNTERERRVGDAGNPPPCDRTVSVWDFFNSPPENELNINPDYDPSLDDPSRRGSGADMGVLMPNPKDVRFWYQLYGRADDEMNGRFVTRQLAQDPEYHGPIDTASDDPVNNPGATPSSVPLPPSPGTSPSPSIAIAQPETRRTVDRIPSPSGHASSSMNPGSPRTRHESMRRFDRTLTPPNRTTQPSPVPPRTPSPLSTRTYSTIRPQAGMPSADLFSSGGVRSMWGRFSTNATAALSAVQDAYGGMAKDFKVLSLGGTSPGDGQGGELRSREEIGAWGDSGAEPELAQRSSPPRSAGIPQTLGASTNPWATSRPNVPSVLLHNPWTAADPQAPEPPAKDVDVSHRQESSSSGDDSRLPLDPTVAFPSSPAPRIRSTESISPHLTPIISDAERSTPSSHKPPSPSPAAPATSASDPLGVGVW
ncbi:protein-tyrosine phosphatase-like protein [Fomitopsis serialis]|uniref:protein-tyrosine phosphatase-like protein n=1 Tax=Fomitopsis serialis TaxID=139415 RepID=UPI0020080A73|nr:protein-tyrosine phosphatase-like protein [Neoantrodia serialis]KAH9930636.1 protein-tyrosine phosphatase-like protein [Neoantrodia serialis]